MWALFSKSVLPDYEIGDVIENPLASRSLWTLKEGRSKKLNTPVSVFIGDAKNRFCRNALQRIKTLKHPNILPYIGHHETDKELYVITVPVTPAAQYLNRFDDCSKELLYALFSIGQALKFLNLDANLVHNAVQLGAIYVCCKTCQVESSYGWYLWDLDYSSDTARSCDLPAGILDIFSPVEIGDLSSGDSWGFGCLMWELFNYPYPSEFDCNCLLDTSKFRSTVLVGLYKKLMASRANQRLPISRFIVEVDRHLLQNDKICKLFNLLNSDTLLTQNSIERRKTIIIIDKILEFIPDRLQVSGVVPLLISRLRPIADTSLYLQILPLLLRIGEMMSSEEYRLLIIPTILTMYDSSDRALRVELLLQLDKYVEYLSNDLINQKLYSLIARGMLDTHPSVREATLRSFLLLAPKLSAYTLNNDLLKLLSVTHARDPIGGVRTNTIILLVNLMPLLDVNKRGSILCGALCRTLRDPFKPARDAAVAAVTKSLIYLNRDLISKTLLPSLCPLLVDDCSEELFKVIRKVIDFLEDIGTKEITPSSELISSSKAGWTEWALSMFINEKPIISPSLLADKVSSDLILNEDEKEHNFKVNDRSDLILTKSSTEFVENPLQLHDNVGEIEKSQHSQFVKSDNVKSTNAFQPDADSENDFFESMLREEKQKKKVGKRLGGHRLKS